MDVHVECRWIHKRPFSEIVQAAWSMSRQTEQLRCPRHQRVEWAPRGCRELAFPQLLQESPGCLLGGKLVLDS